MKKLHILLAAALLAAGFSSCDMEKYPYNAVEESLYMTSTTDFANARIGLYSSYRGLTTGGYILLPEMQCDDFNATVGYSNSYGNMYRWDFQSSDGNIQNYWSNYYLLIARCNYFIDSYLKLKEGNTSFSDADMAKIRAYVGEAYFTRAFSYFNLANHFCKAYNSASADADLGMPLQLTYAPTSNSAVYPGRSSMKETFAQIISDLDNAKELVNIGLALDKGKSAINYISTDVVTALQARVALQMKDYAAAATAATSLIAAGKYALVNSAETFRGMWVNDMSSEVMWQIYMSADELGSATGTSFWGQYQEDPAKVTTDYIPTGKLVDLYEKNDIRFAAFFAPFTLNVATGAQGNIYMFDKYPGNPDIYTIVGVDNHYTNKSKPFRIAEQYLIAAEAYAGQGNVTEAAKYLNDLKRNRIEGYTDRTFNSADLLMAEIRDERHRELVGEGFRLSDLKRWGLGVNRQNNVQDANLVLFPDSEITTALEKAADDFRMVWPIPKAETDVNPQIRNQQNPGY
ncbi:MULTISPECIES: RagB/SusD family nutrient uptake outer membrane protein [Bacteroides]|uniref:RagB/SusD family nutrient uptake outer membrane protein n=1 Tax=Bacteroides muris (ex Fokt et al. 2023) TaxID=2937417 RepID=A0A9X2P159_9BACE|nr:MULTISPECIES: RagB/SusD family nutrient uptake outer membrane protein [Bacteroides]MCR6509963.1 RagB/SusD family nutrient uptake outer membrane protein [Bacteroides muris (ex Fokt et al. 2023)]NVK93749.1 RagB/SusD family nutrient uptake outer membrane protein [Bacteroides sp. L10-4]